MMRERTSLCAGCIRVLEAYRAQKRLQCSWCYSLNPPHRGVFTPSSRTKAHRLLWRVVHPEDIRKCLLGGERDRGFSPCSELARRGRPRTLARIRRESDATISFWRRWWAPFFAQKTHRPSSSFLHTVLRTILREEKRQVESQLLLPLSG